MIRYCWLSEQLDFSASWDQETQDGFIDADIVRIANEQGFRLVKYEIIIGKGFEFPYKSRLINPKSIIDKGIN